MHAVDDQSEISFSIPQGTLPWQSIFGFSAWMLLDRRLVAQPGGLTLGFAQHLVPDQNVMTADCSSAGLQYMCCFVIPLLDVLGCV